MRPPPYGSPLFFVILVTAWAAACGPSPAPVPPAPPVPTAEAPASRTPEPPAREGYTAADVAFMQDMLAHHQQALVMTALVPERTERDQLRQLARRIDISQESEMALMRRW